MTPELALPPAVWEEEPPPDPTSNVFLGELARCLPCVCAATALATAKLSGVVSEEASELPLEASGPPGVKKGHFVNRPLDGLRDELFDEGFVEE